MVFNKIIDLSNNTLNINNNSISLNLESLTIEYNVLLIKYQQAILNYINYFKQGTTEQTFATIAGQTFWGSTPLNTYTNITNVTDCQAQCANTPNCTGATFNPTDNGQPMCWIRSGEGSVMPGSTNDYAIVPEAQNLLKIVQSINDELTQVNNQILKIIKKGEPVYNWQAEMRENKAKELIQNYTNLVIERDKIEKNLKEHSTLDETQQQGNLLINANYYSFLLLLGLAIAIMFILYKFPILNAPKENNTSQFESEDTKINHSFYAIVAIIFSILIIYLNYKKISDLFMA
jgi:hypothetical protein